MNLKDRIMQASELVARTKKEAEDAENREQAVIDNKRTVELWHQFKDECTHMVPEIKDYLEPHKDHSFKFTVEGVMFSLHRLTNKEDPWWRLDRLTPERFGGFKSSVLIHLHGTSAQERTMSLLAAMGDEVIEERKEAARKADAAVKSAPVDGPYRFISGDTVEEFQSLLNQANKDGYIIQQTGGFWAGDGCVFTAIVEKLKG